MSVVIIDYGSGNLRSVAKALEHVAPAATITVTRKAEALKHASHIVLPGVGAFGDCVAGLKALPGMMEALEEEVRAKGKIFLGICVGMQMLFERGHEHGIHDGLGWLKGEVVPLAPQDASLKIPHMGWNELETHRSHPLLADIEKGAHAYFVHSYHATCKEKNEVIAACTYGQKITAVVAKDNIMGTQFHPEKSQETGLRLLGNFVTL